MVGMAMETSIHVTQHQGKKFDTGKLPVSLLPFRGIAPIIQVLEFGAKKYGRNNWKLLNSLKDKRRILDALGRHYGAILDGEAIDPESGLSHLAHLGCNVVFLLWHRLSQDDLDRLVNSSECDSEPDALAIVDSLEEFPAADTGVGGSDPAAGSYVGSNPPSGHREPS